MNSEDNTDETYKIILEYLLGCMSKLNTFSLLGQQSLEGLI